MQSRIPAVHETVFQSARTIEASGGRGATPVLYAQANRALMRVADEELFGATDVPTTVPAEATVPIPTPPSAPVTAPSAPSVAPVVAEPVVPAATTASATAGASTTVSAGLGWGWYAAGGLGVAAAAGGGGGGGGGSTSTNTSDTTAPQITGPSGSAGAASSAHSIAENGTAVHNFTANESVTWSIAGGADAARFAIGSNGQLAFLSAPDFENPGDADHNNSYLVDIKAQDAAGNSSTQSVTVTVSNVDEAAADTTPPSLTITDDTSGTASGSVVFTFTFSEPVTGFVASDIRVSNGSKGTFTGSGAVYSLVVTPEGAPSGDIGVSVEAGAAEDAASNQNLSASASQPYNTGTNNSDTTPPAAPTLALLSTSDSGQSSSDGITRNSSPTFRVTFNGSGATLPVAGDSVRLYDDGTVVGSIQLVANDITRGYVDLTPSSPLSEGEHGLLAAKVADAAGNVSPESTAVSIKIDNGGPLLQITDPETGTATGPVTFTFQFNEPVSGFDIGDISVSAGGKGALTGSGDRYSLTVTPGTGFNGNITVSVAAGVAQDLAGNSNVAAQNVQAFGVAAADTTAPVLTITDDTPGTARGAVNFTFTFSEPVTGFTAIDVAVSGGSKGSFVAQSGTVYTLQVMPPADSAGDLVVDVGASAATDAAGNPNAAVRATQAYATDTTAPVLTITDNVVGTANGKVTFTFSFSESVTGFDASDVVVSNGSKGTFSGSGATYSLEVTPTTNSNGTINVDIDAGAATDLAGNPNALTQATQAYDTKAPTLTITDNIAGTANGDVVFTFTFSEPVYGFTATDVQVTNGDKGAFTGADGAQVYTLTVAPSLVSGSLTVAVPADSLQDAVGNVIGASTPAVQAFSGAHPPLIDLGQYGKLIMPVKVDGENWYYYWDRSGDGTANDTGSLNGGVDSTTHDVLDGIFTRDVNGNVGGGGNTTDTYRWATLNGVKVALPTANGGLAYPNGINSYQPGTVIDNSPVGETNVTYNDLLAVWDGYNGTGTGTATDGTPSGWQLVSYWSATPSASGHALVSLYSGYVTNSGDSFSYGYVALLVG